MGQARTNWASCWDLYGDPVAYDEIGSSLPKRPHSRKTAGMPKGYGLTGWN
jgi:hypothetical protein